MSISTPFTNVRRLLRLAEEGPCPRCKRHMPVGTSVLPAEDTQEMVHRDCVKPPASTWTPGRSARDEAARRAAIKADLRG